MGLRLMEKIQTSSHCNLFQSRKCGLCGFAHPLSSMPQTIHKAAFPGLCFAGNPFDLQGVQVSSTECPLGGELSSSRASR